MNYLNETYFFDYSNPVIQDFVSTIVEPTDTNKEKSIKIYNAIRDRWFYVAHGISTTKEGWKASNIFNKEKGHCIEKSIALVTCLRAVNIPARLHLAKVKNHIAVERIIEKLGTDELTPHGYVDIYLNDKWIKASPAFNASLCQKLNVTPLDFDGVSDSLFQEFDKEGGKFMEYLEDYGHFEDVPLPFIYQNLQEHYAAYYKSRGWVF